MRSQQSVSGLWVLLVGMLLSSTASAENWWIYHVGKKKCMPAESASGLNMHPTNVKAGFPQCTVSVANQESGIMMLDCTKSRLRTSFVYGNSLLACMQAKKVVQRMR